jgi:hypothetical protein
MLAPYGGMNTRDGLASLQPFEARRLRNLIPTGNAVTQRKGRVGYSIGATAVGVNTLYTYESVSGTDHLIGIYGDDVYRFDAPTPVKIFDGNYITNDRFIMENYGGRLIGVAQGETPFTYDGTTVAATGFTGVTLTKLANIAKCHNRLWFCETGSADAWYGPLGGITGALVKFQISQIASGGYLMAVAPHSHDGGDGPDDYTAFIMSTGEVIVYSGDPSSTFTKVGNFSMPPPLGRRCWLQIGGQLAILTQMGLVPLTAAISGIAMDAVAIGPFGKISPTIQRAALAYGHLPGWQMVYFNGAVIINCPTSDVTSQQGYYNVLNGTWTILEDLPISCLSVMGDCLYFGGWDDGIVYEYDGILDVDEPIRIESRGSFQGTGSHTAVAAMIRFDMQLNGALTGKFGVDVDYGSKALRVPDEVIATTTTTTPWGSPWGSMWSSSPPEATLLWFSTQGEGRKFAIAIEGSVSAEIFEWFSTELMLEIAPRVV